MGEASGVGRPVVLIGGADGDPVGRGSRLQPIHADNKFAGEAVQSETGRIHRTALPIRRSIHSLGLRRGSMCARARM